MTTLKDKTIHASISRSLDVLLATLALDRTDGGHFSLPPDRGGFPDRILGGQLLAQAVVAAAATAPGRPIKSLHAVFNQAGTPGAPQHVEVTGLRDGRSIATRDVAVVEDGRPLLVAFASFGPDAGHDAVQGAALDADPVVDADRSCPDPPRPEDVPLLQTWAEAVPIGRHWIDSPPAVEMRLPEPPSFLTGSTARTPRAHWMRLPREVGDDPALHAALLAYASDFFLMDMVFRVHPDELGPGRANGFSLDHAIWFHRPVRFDEWHLHTQEPVALVGDRGLARGAIHDADGNRVASVVQEVLLRPVRDR